jgi:hypothetical protein
MKKFRYILILLCALYSVPSYSDQVSIDIGINLQAYPEFVVVPGYPVYYAPQLQANLFFYDGEYWLYQYDNWYVSSWYNGPWWLVDPEDVPLFILRVPVRYYVQPPIYFQVWWIEEPPHWGEHWGHDWEQHRHGWNTWDRNVHQKPAPLPLYQRQYSGDRYPRQVEQQHELHYRNYRYQARDPLVQQRHRQEAVQGGPVQREIQRAPQERGSMPQDIQRSAPRQQGDSTAPRTPTPQRSGVKELAPVSPKQERPAVQYRRQQPQPDAGQREQQIQRSPGETRQQDRGTRQQGSESRQQGGDAGRESNRGQWQGQERGRDK